MKRVAIFSGLAFALAPGVAGADCGSIPFKPGVNIFEPNQRAVIAWNGREEILLLSTDLRASEPTKVLEVIPFPSQPEVKQGDLEVFRKATELINQRLSRQRRGGFGKMGGFGGGALGDAAPPAGEVTFHEKIGAHDISVVRVLDDDRFVDWVEDYLKRSGVDNPTIAPPMKEVVRQYLKDRFQWFAFNVVDLGPQTATKEAIQYRFQTRFLYYPLRITRTEKGQTDIRLVILSPRLVKMPRPGPAGARLLHRPLPISKSELAELDEDLYELLKNDATTLIRLWAITGLPSRFNRDVITTWYR